MNGEKDSGMPPRFALIINFTSMLTMAVLAVAAMTAAYIWGVMSGRHMDAGDMRPEKATAGPVAPAPEQKETNISILKPQELEFVNELRGESRRPLEVKKEEIPALAQANSAPEAPDLQSARSAQATDSTSEPGNVADLTGAQFDYLFQMAALKNEQAVDSLREKLEGYGLRTRVERTGKLLLVLVPLRGDNARAGEIGRIAQELRLGKPLVRFQKPVVP